MATHYKFSSRRDPGLGVVVLRRDYEIVPNEPAPLLRILSQIENELEFVAEGIWRTKRALERGDADDAMKWLAQIERGVANADRVVQGDG